MVSVMVFVAPQETSDHLDPKRVEVIGLMFVRGSAKPSGRVWRSRAFYLYRLFDGYGLDINTRHVIRKRKNQNSKRNGAEMINSRGIPPTPQVIRICLKTSTIVKKTGRGFHNGRRM
jgi:hypothetical protein